MKNLVALLAIVLSAGCARPPAASDDPSTGARVEVGIPTTVMKVIRRHGSYEQALLDAAKSGKRVLLFKLPGNLDEELRESTPASREACASGTPESPT